jgi:CBS domain-containing protein
VLGTNGRARGLLDRDAMILALREHGEATPISSAMRPAQPLLLAQPLAEAFNSMRSRGANAEVVVDGNGQVVGVLSSGNIAEMMLVNSVRPGWRFRRR